MNLFHHIDLLNQIHFHIEHKSTGSPPEFARRLRLSERSLFRVLEKLKDMDVHIIYNKARGSYEYVDENTITKLLKTIVEGGEQKIFLK